MFPKAAGLGSQPGPSCSHPRALPWGSEGPTAGATYGNKCPTTERQERQPKPERQAPVPALSIPCLQPTLALSGIGLRSLSWDSLTLSFDRSPASPQPNASVSWLRWQVGLLAPTWPVTTLHFLLPPVLCLPPLGSHGQSFCLPVASVASFLSYLVSFLFPHPFEQGLLPKRPFLFLPTPDHMKMQNGYFQSDDCPC